jgi:hypothetical protein
MAGLLVFSAVPLLAFGLWSRMAIPDWRVASVYAALAWAFAVAIGTELLSSFHALRFQPVLAGWLLANVFAAGFAWCGHRRPVAPARGGRWETAFAAVLVALVAIGFAVTLVSPPNTPDVLAYHLPRQLMWLQQGGVQHFVSSDERALMMPPLAEMIQAHAMILAGGDRWAGFPQWLGYLLGLIVTSLIARELGASRRGQWLAALAFATTPMAWHEATSAKNDLLVAVWLGCLAWVGLRLARTEFRPTTSDWLAAGAALGVALATKTTALLFAAAPVALLLPAAVRHPRRSWPIAVLPLLIAGPHALRNFVWYGTPLGEQSAATGGGQGAETLSAGAAVSGALRNATLHLATPSPEANAMLQQFVERAHGWFGQDANDRRTTLWFLRYGVDWGPQHEAIAGAPAQFLLGLGAILLWGVRRSWRGPALTAVLFVIVGALLCCVLLKWQPTGARLHLPVFLVLAALIAAAAERLGTPGVVGAAAACLVAWLPASETQLRPWRTSPTVFATSRWENTFRFHPRERLAVEASLSALAAARPATLQIVSRHGFPYPVMQRFLAAAPEARLWGVLPEAAAAPPSAVLVVEPSDRPRPAEFIPPGATSSYRAIADLAPHTLYLPAPPATASPPAR